MKQRVSDRPWGNEAIKGVPNLFCRNPPRKKRRIPEDIEPCRTEQGKLFVGDGMYESQVHCQSQPGEQAGDLGIILPNFILEVHFADDVDTYSLRAGPGDPRKGDEGVIQTILEGPPENPAVGT